MDKKEFIKEIEAIGFEKDKANKYSFHASAGSSIIEVEITNVTDNIYDKTVVDYTINAFVQGVETHQRYFCPAQDAIDLIKLYLKDFIEPEKKSIVKNGILFDYQDKVIINARTNKVIGSIKNDGKLFTYSTGVDGIKKQFKIGYDADIDRVVNYICEVETKRNELYELLYKLESKVMEDPEDPMRMEEYGLKTKKEVEEPKKELTIKEIDNQLDPEKKEKEEAAQKALRDFFEKWVKETDWSKYL